MDIKESEDSPSIYNLFHNHDRSSMSSEAFNKSFLHNFASYLNSTGGGRSKRSLDDTNNEYEGAGDDETQTKSESSSSLFGSWFESAQTNEGTEDGSAANPDDTVTSAETQDNSNTGYSQRVVFSDPSMYENVATGLNGNDFPGNLSNNIADESVTDRWMPVDGILGEGEVKGVPADGNVDTASSTTSNKIKTSKELKKQKRLLRKERRKNARKNRKLIKDKPVGDDSCLVLSFPVCVCVLLQEFIFIRNLFIIPLSLLAMIVLILLMIFDRTYVHMLIFLYILFFKTDQLRF